MSGGGKKALLLQAKIYPRNDLIATDVYGYVNVTGSGAKGTTILPCSHANGSTIYLGDPGLGYPRELYPNLSYVEDATSTSRAIYNNRTLENSTIILGPLYLSDGNSTLLSVTIPINNNTSRRYVALPFSEDG